MEQFTQKKHEIGGSMLRLCGFANEEATENE